MHVVGMTNKDQAAVRNEQAPLPQSTAVTQKTLSALPSQYFDSSFEHVHPDREAGEGDSNFPALRLGVTGRFGQSRPCSTELGVRHTNECQTHHRRATVAVPSASERLKVESL